MNVQKSFRQSTFPQTNRETMGRDKPALQNQQKIQETLESIKGKVIDAWAQPGTPGFVKMPEVRPLFERSGSVGLFDRGFSLEQTLDAMDEAGIGKLMLSAWYRPGMAVCPNSEIAEIVQKHPDRFIGVASVNLHNPVEAVSELQLYIKEYGFKALRVVPWLWKLPPNTNLYYPLYVKCIELDIPFLTQVGHTGPLMPSEVGRPVPYLDEVMLTFPDLVVVGGHIGYPWTEEVIGMMIKFKNFHIDTSAHLPKMYPKRIVEHLAKFGRKQILFGTNYPQLNLKKCVEQAAALDLPPKAVRSFFYENAQRVFKL